MKEAIQVITDPILEQAGLYFLTGNEVLARASLVAGTRYFASYPGSPITGVMEVMLKASEKFEWLHSQISINESIALHGATGASWTGARALVSMKHVGMHVSSDPAAYLGYTGTVGGLVLAVGVDPGATCSTGEFDIRHLNDAFHWIILEPSNIKEVYEYTLNGFTLSEKWGVPVMVVMPSELCSQHGTFESDIIDSKKEKLSFKKSEKYINNGITAVQHHKELLEKIKIISESTSGHFLKTNGNNSAETAIIATGCNYPAVSEALDALGINDVLLISMGMTYPLPWKRLEKELRKISTLYIAEELDGYLSKHILSTVKRLELDVVVKSLNDGYLNTGNLSMNKLFNKLGDIFNIDYECNSNDFEFKIMERPGTFCPGCPYRGVLYTLKAVMNDSDVYGGDIGCSSLPPYYSDWLTCMGSGLGIAQGVAQVINNDGKVYASMGDSTFFHCGIPIVVNTLQQKTDITLLVLDNRWTAMTGHQPLPNSDTLNGVKISSILKALGAEKLWEVDAYDLRKFREVLYETRRLKGVRIIVVKSECRLKYLETNVKSIKCKIDSEICHQCGECYRILGCPALKYKDDLYYIDEDMCGCCGICAQICPNSSISVVKYY